MRYEWMDDFFDEQAGCNQGSAKGLELDTLSDRWEDVRSELPE